MVIHVPLGVLVLFMLYMFVLAGMTYEAYLRPWLIRNSLKIKPRRKPHMIIRALKVQK